MFDWNAQGFGHMFPYSNIHEMNLDWMLKKVKELTEKVEAFESRISALELTAADHEARIAELEREFTALVAEWNQFKADIEARFDTLEQEIRDEFAALTASIDAKFAALEASIDAKFATLESDINTRFTDLENALRTEIQGILTYIIDTCAEFTEKVTRLTVRVENLEQGMDDCCLTITGKLDEITNLLDTINPELREVVITRNGVYLASDEGADGYYKVTVNVQGGGSAVIESITKNYNANGTYTIYPPTGVDGYNDITVNVAVPASTFETQEKTLNVTANGTKEVTPDAGKDGLSKVTVNTNVPQTVVPTNLETKGNAYKIQPNTNGFYDSIFIGSIDFTGISEENMLLVFSLLYVITGDYNTGSFENNSVTQAILKFYDVNDNLIDTKTYGDTTNLFMPNPTFFKVSRGVSGNIETQATSNLKAAVVSNINADTKRIDFEAIGVACSVTAVESATRCRSITLDVSLLKMR